MIQEHKYSNITSFVFDVDGVLTSSGLLATEENQLLREMNTRDGYALRKAILAGYHILIITGGSSIGVQQRLSKIGIKEIHLSVQDKVKVLIQLMEKYDLKAEEILYMGDDLPDFDAMKLVAYKACPKDAYFEIKKISDYISPIEGGRGCVRDIIEKIMRIQDKW